jgi:hypothetical protein
MKREAANGSVAGGNRHFGRHRKPEGVSRDVWTALLREPEHGGAQVQPAEG